MMDVVVAWARTGPSAAATKQLVLTVVGRPDRPGRSVMHATQLCV